MNLRLVTTLLLLVGLGAHRPAASANPAAQSDGASVTFSDVDYLQSRGDPFDWGRWVSAGGGSGKVESKFSKTGSVSLIRIHTARIGPPGARGKISVSLIKPTGETWKAKEFENTQVQADAPETTRPMLLPSQSLEFKPAIRASGIRFEFSGPGPFALEDIDIRFEDESKALKKPEGTPLAPARKNPLDALAGRWAIADSGGIRVTTEMTLVNDSKRFWGYWNFHDITGGSVEGVWNGDYYEARAELVGEGQYIFRFRLDPGAQRMEGTLTNAVGEALHSNSKDESQRVFFVRRSDAGSRPALLKKIEEFNERLDRSRMTTLRPGEIEPDFSGRWVSPNRVDAADLYFLQIEQTGRKVSGVFQTPQGRGGLEGSVFDGRIYARGIDQEGKRRTYWIRMGDTPDSIKGYTGEYDGMLPSEPTRLWQRVKVGSAAAGDIGLIDPHDK